MQSAADAGDTLGLGAVFTLIFVMLGPIKILGPFAQLTRDLDESKIRKIAVRAFVLSLIGVVIGGFVGDILLQNWNISLPAMLLAGGIMFFLVGMSVVLEQYHTMHPVPPPLPAAPLAAGMRVAFPIVVTPYGVATLIVMLVNSSSASRTLGIIAILIGVMALNLLAMLFAKRIMSGVTVIALQIFGAVLGVLQLALATEIIIRALDELGVLHG